MKYCDIRKSINFITNDIYKLHKTKKSNETIKENYIINPLTNKINHCYKIN